MWALPDRPERLPLTFSIVARAPGENRRSTPWGV